jgi:hypothetical protein
MNFYPKIIFIVTVKQKLALLVTAIVCCLIMGVCTGQHSQLYKNFLSRYSQISDNGQQQRTGQSLNQPTDRQTRSIAYHYQILHQLIHWPTRIGSMQLDINQPNDQLTGPLVNYRTINESSDCHANRIIRRQSDKPPITD